MIHRSPLSLRLALAAGITLAASASVQAAPVLFSASGADAAAIQATVDSFRAAVGDPNNANTPGSQPAGRREINWDGGGADAPVAFFPVPMTTFANRGNVYVTGGTGFSISGQPDPAFGDINPTYPDIFTTFSAPRLFAPLGSNVMDVLFTVPGTIDQAAVTQGFGVVFTDVDLAGQTRIDYFDASGGLLGSASADPFDRGLSFVALLFDDPLVARARIVLGNAALGPNDGDGVDVVAMDDFIYGEPQVAPLQIPEPATLLLLGAAGVLALAGRARSSAARADAV